MNAYIYRFEIVRALSNAVYEIRDPGSGALLTLYEWTPAIADREFAKRRLEEIKCDIKLEVFTADASLYFVAVTEAEALHALQELHANGMFLDGRKKGVPPRGNLPEPVNKVEPSNSLIGIPAPEDKETTKSNVRVRAWYAAAAVLPVGGSMLAVGFVMGQGTQPGPAKSVIIEDSHPASGRELQQAKSRESEAQKLAAAQSQRLSDFAGIRSLRVKNSSSQTYQVAVSFLGFNGLQQVQGWTAIPPGKTQIVAVSSSDKFSLYARRNDGAVVAGSAKSIGIEDGDFLYYAGDVSSNMVLVKPVLISSGLSELR